MKVINPAQPFNVGDEIFVDSGPTWRVSSWNPSAGTVRVMSPRGHTRDIGWSSALRRIVSEA